MRSTSHERITDPVLEERGEVGALEHLDALADRLDHPELESQRPDRRGPAGRGGQKPTTFVAVADGVEGDARAHAAEPHEAEAHGKRLPGAGRAQSAPPCRCPSRTTR